jgi:hypothetical protein
VDEAEIPVGVVDLDAVEMPITVRHLEAAHLMTDLIFAPQFARNGTEGRSGFCSE